MTMNMEGQISNGVPSQKKSGQISHRTRQKYPSFHGDFFDFRCVHINSWSTTWISATFPDFRPASWPHSPKGITHRCQAPARDASRQDCNRWNNREMWRTTLVPGHSRLVMEGPKKHPYLMKISQPECLLRIETLWHCLFGGPLLAFNLRFSLFRVLQCQFCPSSCGIGTSQLFCLVFGAEAARLGMVKLGNAYINRKKSYLQRIWREGFWGFLNLDISWLGFIFCKINMFKCFISQGGFFLASIPSGKVGSATKVTDFSQINDTRYRFKGLGLSNWIDPKFAFVANRIHIKVLCI